MRPRLRPGLTLLELLLQLCILAILLGMAAPSLRRTADRWAVVACRDELAALLRRTRAGAVALGGARLELDLAAGVVRGVSAAEERIVAPRALGDEYRVRIRAEGAAAGTVVIAFDRLGIGRLANRTIRIRRGREEAGITISAYGRVRVW